MFSLKTVTTVTIICLFAGTLHAEEAFSVSDDNLAGLINQLGQDEISDALTRGKLRQLLEMRRSVFFGASQEALEEEVWTGTVERVYVDLVNDQGEFSPGPTEYYLHAGKKRLQVFFLDRVQAEAASGKRLEVRGYRSGRKALIIDAVRKQQGSTGPD